MSETPKPNQYPDASKKESEPFAHEEQLQFKDGRVAFGFKTPGDRIVWEGHTRTSGLGIKDSPDIAIVSTESGRRFAVGSGVAVMLPEKLTAEGRFKSDTKELPAKSIVDDLPDVTIGEPWQLLGDGDKVSDVVIDYTNMPPNQPGAHQIGYENPFDHARDITREVAQKMEAAGQLYPDHS